MTNRLFTVLVCALMTACGADKEGTATIGPSGGSVKLKSGSSVSLPAKSLSKDVQISGIDSAAPTNLAGVTTVGDAVTLGPEGQTFEVPVKVTLVFDPSKLPRGRTSNDVVIYTAPVGSSDFTVLPTTLEDTTHVSALTSHFSVFVPGVTNSQPSLSYAGTSQGPFSIENSWTISPTLLDGGSSDITACVLAAGSDTIGTGGAVSINATTCVISGRQLTRSDVGVYTLKAVATNANGDSTDPQDVSLTLLAPATVAYDGGTALGWVGQPLSVSPLALDPGGFTDKAKTQAASVTCALASGSAALPAGLTINSQCVISGTPTVGTSGAASFSILAANAIGGTPTTVTLDIVSAAPSGLSYAGTPIVATKGVAISSTVPSISGGRVVSYSISPSLPAGLTFDPATGALAGTPTVLAPRATFTVTATNPVGSTTATIDITVNDVQPSALSYPPASSVVFTKGQAITARSPTVSGGAVVSYSIAPALPSGLSINTMTGVISGTPTALQSATQHTITATNTGGSTTALLSITVNDVAPSALTYSSATVVYIKGQTITANTPSSMGGSVVSYSVAPALPSGLTLSAMTGAISGTPTAVSAAAMYTVTATNSGGSATATISITVNDAPPTSLAYSSASVSYTKGQAITANTPSNMGGAVVSYGVTPALPAGLSLNTSSGIISGTPTALAPTAQYTITATNLGGSTTVSISITVNDAAPSTLTYTTSNAVYVKGSVASANSPTSSGGPVVSYTISPVLPAGLSFDTNTGVISGTPTAVAAAASYTVTATNSGGSTTVALGITVNDVPPTFTNYSGGSGSYTKGQSVTWSPTTSGGAVTSFTVTPALPAGLSLDSMTGIISGTPTTVTALQAYVVRASNSGGTAPYTLNFQVIDLPPAQLTYSIPVTSYSIGQAGITNTPANTGGAITSYTVTPALPTGLTLNSGTGVISGTPTAAANVRVYTITGTNSGGSTSATLRIGVQPPRVIGSAGALALGQQHGCAVVNGGVQCWGYNGNGQLGDGTRVFKTSPVFVSGLAGGVQALAAGDRHTCALVNGGVQCWGANAFGQLGNNSTTDSTVPVQVQGLTSGVQSIHAKQDFTCAVVGGTAKCWGDNQGGQIGDGTTTNRLVPTAVTGLTGIQWLALGALHGCAVVNGGVKCWGNNQAGQIGNGTNVSAFSPVQVTGLTSGVQAIASSAQSTCAIVNGSIRCWGRNHVGQLGDSQLSGLSSTTPVSVQVIPSGASSIAGGGDNMCAVLDGSIWCWGDNSVGQRGTGVAGGITTTPVPVTNLSGAGVITASVGGSSVCALANGAIQCWGGGGFGQLGNGQAADSADPVMTTGLGNSISGIASGGYHTCAIVNGGLQCWGGNFSGSLGNNSTTPSSSPIAVTGLSSGVTAVAGGLYMTCAIVNGAVKCWGSNTNGQMGNSTFATNVLVPTQVPGLTSGVQSISVGASQACAVVSGSAKCWGFNNYGQVGFGSTTPSNQPVVTQVTGLTTGVQAVYSGQSTNCALVNGAIKCFGFGNDGELATGSQTFFSSTPIASTMTSGVSMMWPTGNYNTFALIDGALKAWGATPNGELGINSTTATYSPVTVQGFTSGVQYAGGGSFFACAIVNGGISCWGKNDSGQLGIGTSAPNSLVPVATVGLGSGAQMLAPGGFHSCAVVAGSIQCWGQGTESQLGNAAALTSSVPVEVAGF